MPATIYKTPLPEATTKNERDSLGTQLSEQGVLGSDAIVEALSSQAADLTLTGRYALGRYYSELVATELEELADAAIGAVPLYGGGSNRSGYYQIESAQVEPVHAGGRDIWEWTLSLTNAGTRKSQLQAVKTEASQPTPGHEFGNDTSALVGVPAAARQPSFANCAQVSFTASGSPSRWTTSFGTNSSRRTRASSIMGGRVLATA